MYLAIDLGSLISLAIFNFFPSIYLNKYCNVFKLERYTETP